MQIVSVSVSYSHGFNDPCEQFANHKPSVTLHAELGPWDVVGVEIDSLFQQARDMVAAQRKSIEQQAQCRVKLEQLARMEERSEHLGEQIAECDEKDAETGRVERLQHMLTDEQRAISAIKAVISAAGFGHLIPTEPAKGKGETKSDLDDDHIPF